ncbi:MAG: P-II family nitrogen regulator [Dehalococcoidia bacterium]|jgi:nitrogen regulatory protein P-II 1|nr:P-II family nitrogen regulator [Dehalococcoidia bacterium]
MKKIEAIVRPERVTAVKEALEKLGYPGMTLTEVKGHGKQKGLVQQWRGSQYRIEFLPKVKIELVVENGDSVEPIIQAIVQQARTGEAGDGKIFVWPIEEVVRIRTGERGTSAV